jgi:hypothetical protein
MVYKIEKGIKPKRGDYRPIGNYGYPLDSMKVGDSFVVKEIYDNNNRTKIASRVNNYLKKLAKESKSPEELLGRVYRIGKDPISDKYIRVWRQK